MMDFMSKPFVDPDTAGWSRVKESLEKDNVKLFHVSASDKPELIKYLDNAPNFESVPHPGKFRTAALYRNKTDLFATIEEIVQIADSLQPIPASKPKLCFLITCQGTHYPAMGKQLYAESPVFRKHFDFCAVHVLKEYDIDVKSFLEWDVVPGVVPEWMESPIKFLPYLLALEYALFKQWEEWGIKPDYVLGLSFGEYGAAVFAGMITIEEAFKLIMTRIILMTENIKEEAFCVSQMGMTKYAEILAEAKTAVGMEEMWLDVSAINSPVQTCVVGHLKYVNQFAATCKKHWIKTLIKEYHPYHSSLTKPILPEFLKTTSSIRYVPGTAKFISTVDGKLWETLDPNYFLDHLTGPVMSIGAVETALAEGVTHFVEVGPHPIIIQMVKDILQNNDPHAENKYTFVTSMTRKEDDRLALLNSVGRLYTAGYDVNWENVDKFQGQGGGQL
ncbi:malonyl CoA-acyl carrier protein transacylase-like [Folsomia candida]|nr:malonyl CoA-acyl carrier protein transacylase-like [Folsomia candida]